MDIFRLIGQIAVGVGALGVLWVLYHIVRGVILACDFVIWQFYMTKQRKPDLKFDVRLFLRGVGKNWVDMIAKCMAGLNIFSVSGKRCRKNIWPLTSCTTSAPCG